MGFVPDDIASIPNEASNHLRQVTPRARADAYGTRRSPQRSPAARVTHLSGGACMNERPRMLAVWRVDAPSSTSAGDARVLVVRSARPRVLRPPVDTRADARPRAPTRTATSRVLEANGRRSRRQLDTRPTERGRPAASRATPRAATNRLQELLGQVQTYAGSLRWRAEIDVRDLARRGAARSGDRAPDDSSSCGDGAARRHPLICLAACAHHRERDELKSARQAAAT